MDSSINRVRARACFDESIMLLRISRSLKDKSEMLRAESRMAESRMLMDESEILMDESEMLKAESIMLREMKPLVCKKLIEEDLREKLILPQVQYRVFVDSIPSEVRSKYLDQGFIPCTLLTLQGKYRYLESKVQLKLVGFVPNTDSSFCLQLPRLEGSMFKVDLEIEVRYGWPFGELLLLVNMPHGGYCSRNFLSPPPITRIEIYRSMKLVDKTSAWMDLGEKWITDNDFTNKIILFHEVDITNVCSSIKNNLFMRYLMDGMGFKIFIWPYQNLVHLTHGMLKVIKVRHHRTVDIEISCTRAYALRGALKPGKMVRVFFRWINARPYLLLRAGREAFGPEGERKPPENFGDEFIPSRQFRTHWALLPFCPSPCRCCPRWTSRTSDGGLDTWLNIDIIDRKMDRERFHTRKIDRQEFFDNLV